MGEQYEAAFFVASLGLFIPSIGYYLLSKGIDRGWFIQNNEKGKLEKDVENQD